ncbi:acetylxylan esterase [Kineococcus rhizosphaerae]|uniref:Cephalosporin-C deacetylase n=1 Tax=Kineococcus rhizosphaerae TaxID=559628 RepID=A0A2T0QRB4_9ACTN|nr:acetylxylan esterase [Kineococcus rhizosphaerae]PRY07329.1 cephalosporin-C deacetylase [Kineococcus rhizosphaerae]
MAFVDQSLEWLRAYAPSREEPDDFDEFWSQTLAAARRWPARLEDTTHDAGLRSVKVYDVRFPGFGGQPIAGWLLVPREINEPAPAVVQYVGYGGGRGEPWINLVPSAAGYIHLIMDNRGQGGGGGHRAITPDLDEDGHGPGPSSPGLLTRGIQSPHRHYLRRLITDAARAVDAIRTHPLVDPDCVAVIGGSQGGGLALAVAGLVDGLRAVVADVPFLSHYRRASQITDTQPYAEIARYLSGNRGMEEQAFRTLSYVDAVNFSARASAPAWISVGLMDGTCPPSTVYAAYHHYSGTKDLKVYPYNGHEGGGSEGVARTLAALASTLRV